MDMIEKKRRELSAEADRRFGKTKDEKVDLNERRKDNDSSFLIESRLYQTFSSFGEYEKWREAYNKEVHGDSWSLSGFGPLQKEVFSMHNIHPHKKKISPALAG